MTPEHRPLAFRWQPALDTASALDGIITRNDDGTWVLRANADKEFQIGPVSSYEELVAESRAWPGLSEFLQSVRAVVAEGPKVIDQLEHQPVEQQHSARFLLAITARLMSPLERDRYVEEFRAELLDLPRHKRLRYALSLLRGVFALRLRRGLKNKAADNAVRRLKS